MEESEKKEGSPQGGMNPAMASMLEGIDAESMGIPKEAIDAMMAGDMKKAVRILKNVEDKSKMPPKMAAAIDAMVIDEDERPPEPARAETNEGVPPPSFSFFNLHVHPWKP